MKIFLLGYSEVGKTSLAQELRNHFPEMIHVRAGGWIREGFPDKIDRLELTELACEKLRTNPDICLNYIKSNYDLSQKYLILDGIRNPYDFVHLFNPLEDIVFYLSRINQKAASWFEKDGLASIFFHISFLENLYEREFFYHVNLDHLHLNSSSQVYHYILPKLEKNCGLSLSKS